MNAIVYQLMFQKFQIAKSWSKNRIPAIKVIREHSVHSPPPHTAHVHAFLAINITSLS